MSSSGQSPLNTSSQLNQSTQSMVTLTYVIYGLHLFSAVTGLLSEVLIVTAFLTGWPSIIAVILNYLKRSEVRGTWLESHFAWQIRTFWFALLWLAIAGMMFITLVGIPAAVIVVLFVGIWIIYRIVRGLLALMNSEAMPF